MNWNLEEFLTGPSGRVKNLNFPGRIQYRNHVIYWKVRFEVNTETGTIFFGKGDYVVFPKGISCTWKVLEPVKKHYTMG